MEKDNKVVPHFRPRTRGELKRKLEEGVVCEVVGYVSEMTAIMLRGWMEFGDFTVVLSENYGWNLFVPVKGKI